jgi:serine/threonine protein kinase
LQLLSALSLIHSRGIAYGEITEENCWLTTGSLSIALAGFVGADFQDPSNGWNLPGHFFSGIEFSPHNLPLERKEKYPTRKTDMFVFGRLVYELMTSHMPGNGLGRDWGETERLVEEEDWMPDLEDEFMGKIVHKCWKFEYEDVEELQREVQALIEAQGWSIKGDELEGFDANSIQRELEANFVLTEEE